MDGMRKEEVLKRMEREGYLERRREVVAGEEGVDFVVGGRGKLEVGIEGVKGLVMGVYGFGRRDEAEDGVEDEDEANGRKEKQQELESRLARSLGLNDRVKANKIEQAEDAEMEDTQEARRGQIASTEAGPSRRGRGRPARTQKNRDDDDEY